MRGKLWNNPWRDASSAKLWNNPWRDASSACLQVLKDLECCLAVGWLKTTWKLVSVVCVW
jgi:hypothetical protein